MIAARSNAMFQDVTADLLGCRKLRYKVYLACCLAESLDVASVCYRCMFDDQYTLVCVCMKA
jgi:hypothetical protein